MKAVRTGGGRVGNEGRVGRGATTRARATMCMRFGGKAGMPYGQEHTLLVAEERHYGGCTESAPSASTGMQPVTSDTCRLQRHGDRMAGNCLGIWHFMLHSGWCGHTIHKTENPPSLRRWLRGYWPQRRGAAATVAAKEFCQPHPASPVALPPRGYRSSVTVPRREHLLIDDHS